MLFYNDHSGSIDITLKNMHGFIRLCSSSLGKKSKSYSPGLGGGGGAW